MRGRKPKPFECPEPLFWYAVGLIATDGCLSSDGRHVNITAKDHEYLSGLRNALGVSCQVTKCYGSSGQMAHRLQIGSRALYDRLLTLGLTPKKSLTIPALNVPDEGFRDFLRGVIDGDGNIRRWQHPTNGREQWAVRIYGASKPFIRWLQATTERLWRVRGFIYYSKPQNERHHTLYTLKYGKLAAKVILEQCYYPGSFALARKRTLAEACAAASVGWSKSKTVGDRDQWHHWKYVHVWTKRPTGYGNPDDQSNDPAAGIFSDGDAVFGEPGWRNWRNALGLKPSGAKASCGFDSHPRHLTSLWESKAERLPRSVIPKRRPSGSARSAGAGRAPAAAAPMAAATGAATSR